MIGACRVFQCCVYCVIIDTAFRIVPPGYFVKIAVSTSNGDWMCIKYVLNT